MVMLYDTIPLDGMRKTEDGYLVAFSRVGRTGIQIYKGAELGRADLGDVRVYRPPEEVFNDAAMASCAHRPITIEHPTAAVDASNWSKLSKGATGGEVVRDGEFVRVPLVLMDAGAIATVENGKKELSLGYKTTIDWTPGKTPDQQVYDAVSRDIRVNHLAVTDHARGGSQLRIGDEDKHMSEATRNILVDGIPINVGDVAAGVITRALDTASKRVADAEKTAKEKEDELKKLKKDSDDAADVAKKAVEAKDGEIAVLKKQVTDAQAASTPEKLDGLVKDRLAVVDKARQVLGDKYVTDGKSDAVIRRDVVVSKIGDAAAKTLSDDGIVGAFQALTVDAGQGGTRHLARSFVPDGATPRNAAEARDAAYAESGKNLADAWRYPNGRPAEGARQ